MRKADLVSKIAEETNVAKVDVLVTLENLFTEIKNALASGENVYIRGFGSLSPNHYKRKVARNIHKNETIVIAEHYTPHFKPAKSFKNRTKNL